MTRMYASPDQLLLGHALYWLLVYGRALRLWSVYIACCVTQQLLGTTSQQVALPGRTRKIMSFIGVLSGRQRACLYLSHQC